MYEVNKKEILSILSLELYADLHNAKDKISYFQNKYQKSFKEFENIIGVGEESFKEWDDYIEWKAYECVSSEILKKLNDIKNENITIA
jgi:hypothetical protein